MNIFIVIVVLNVIMTVVDLNFDQFADILGLLSRDAAAVGFIKTTIMKIMIDIFYATC